VIAAAALAAIAGFLDASVVNVAVPAIGRDLGANLVASSAGPAVPAPGLRPGTSDVAEPSAGDPTEDGLAAAPGSPQSGGAEDQPTDEYRRRAGRARASEVLRPDQAEDT
jgi:hypothetical protein